MCYTPSCFSISIFGPHSGPRLSFPAPPPRDRSEHTAVLSTLPCTQHLVLRQGSVGLGAGLGGWAGGSLWGVGPKSETAAPPHYAAPRPPPALVSHAAYRGEAL